MLILIGRLDCVSGMKGLQEGKNPVEAGIRIYCDNDIVTSDGIEVAKGGRWRRSGKKGWIDDKNDIVFEPKNLGCQTPKVNAATYTTSSKNTKQMAERTTISVCHHGPIISSSLLTSC